MLGMTKDVPYFDKTFIYIGMSNELAFCELRTKQVINVIDGKCLGRVCDIIFSRHSSKVLGFVVPGDAAVRFFRRREDMFIPFEKVCKIGIDVILVELKAFTGTERLIEIEEKV